MSVQAQMHELGWLFGFHFWYADRRFVRPGIYVWARGENRRLVALPFWIVGKRR